MAGLREAIDAMRGAIQGIVPRMDPTCRFTARANTDRETPYDWARNPKRKTRQFMVEAVGIEQIPACWMASTVEITLIYEGALADGDLRAYEDAGRIGEELLLTSWRPPNVLTLGPTTADRLELVEVDGRIVTRVLVMSARLEYREER